MYMYIHAHGRRPQDTTMSIQEDTTDLKPVKKRVGCTAATVATELLIRQYGVHMTHI